MGERPDPVGLVWGVLFLAAAAFGVANATGHPVRWHLVLVWAPAALVALGVLVAALSRRRP